METIHIEINTFKHAVPLNQQGSQLSGRIKIEMSGMDDLIDSFIECWQGKYGRISVVGNIVVQDYQAGGSMTFADRVHAVLCSLQDSVPDSELKNIIDEMKALADRLKYLLTLK